MTGVSALQELEAANETLRSLQTQLELVPSPSSPTVRVLLDTKDARIATLEKEIRLLERELLRLEAPVIHRQPSLVTLLPRSAAASYVDLAAAVPYVPQAPQAPLKRQVSFLLNDVKVGKDGSVLGRL